ncbi:MAG: hypothetical protein RW306_07265 [Geobacteraceae bacterium]|nr:hypothetical protein [Geobacteraceae bacterium]
MKGTEANRVPAKIKVVYLKGYKAAIEEICQKLEAQAFKISENIEQLELEQKGA